VYQEKLYKKRQYYSAGQASNECSIKIIFEQIF